MHIYITVHETIKRGVVGARGIIVDAKDQEAIDFYSRYDLEVVAGEMKFPKRMFIRSDRNTPSIARSEPARK